MMNMQAPISPLQSELLPYISSSPQRKKSVALVDWAKCFSHDDSWCSSDDYDDDEDSITEEEELQESLVVKALVQATFDRTLAKPVLNRLVGGSSSVSSDGPPKKRARFEQVSTSTSYSPSLTPRALTAMRLSLSAPALSKIALEAGEGKTATTTSTDATTDSNVCKPDDFLKSMLESAGHKYKTHPALSLKKFFRDVTEESIEAYDMKVLHAVRHEDVEVLREMFQSGRTLQCGNRFGESIVHTVCRRGSSSVLKFLLEEAGVSCRVCCDYGRTPLHDACWTSSPNFAVIDLLVDACPDFLYTTDKRGFTPLAYIRPDQSRAWREFLERRGVDRLVPRELVC